MVIGGHMFKFWLLEMEDKNYSFYKNLLIGKLNLDADHGLSQEIDTWQPDRLISILQSLGEFAILPQNIQDQVIGQIKSGSGTLEDVVKIMSSSF